MKLFQYGVITFPSGQQNSNTLCYYPIACKNVDGKNIYLPLNEFH